jgi:hypothetical protein
MAVTLKETTRNVAVNAVVDLLDVGTSNSTGDIAFCNSSNTVLCVNNLQNPAFGTAPNPGVGTATANLPIAQGTVSVAGTIDRALFRDRDNTEVFRCTVGTSGTDIVLSGVVVNINDTIDITSLTYSQP